MSFAAVHCPLRNIAIVVAWTTLWASHGLAQDTAADAGAPTEVLAEAVALEDISEQAVVMATMLETLAPRESSAIALQRAEESSGRLLEDLESRQSAIRAALDATPKVQAMQEWESDLRGLLAPLKALDTELDSELVQLRQAVEKIDVGIASWTLTRDSAANAEMSTEVRGRIDSTLNALNEARSRVVAQRTAVLALRDRLVDPIGNADRLLSLLREKVQGRLAGILKRERAAIWKADLGTSIREELREGGTETLARRLGRMKDYTLGQLPMIAFQISLFVALAFGLRLLGSRARELSVEGYDLRDASLVFAMPTSMALVVTLSFTGWLHPNAPFLFDLIAYTVVFIPATMIASRFLSSANRPVLWALLVIFLIERVRDFLDTVPTLERIVFLAELVGALAFLVWLRQPRRIANVPAEVRKEMLFRVVRRLTGVAAGLFVVTIVAELIGLGDLADLIGSGTLRSAYLALFIYAVYKVLQGLVAYALILAPLRHLKMISAHRQLTRVRIDKLLRFIAFALWAYFTLDYFGLSAPLTTAVVRAVSAELAIGAVAISLGDVLVLVITIWLTFVLARWIDFALNQDVFPRVALSRGVPYAISTLTRYTLIFFGFMIALAAAGIELTKLSIVAGGLGVGIGFGLQTIVSNFVSGLILLFERPLKVGDDITVKTVNGEIRQIGIRASSIRTYDGAEVILPNSQLIAEAVTNWTFRGRRRRVEITVAVKGGIDAQDVIDVLVAAARAQPGILDTPSPKAFLGKYGEASLEFVLQAWIAEYRDEASTRSNLTIAIQKALAEAGIVDPLRRVTAAEGPEPDASGQGT